MKFDEMSEKWDIPSSIVHCDLRDAGANKKKALLLSGFHNIDCTVHKIQLVVEKWKSFKEGNW